MYLGSLRNCVGRLNIDEEYYEFGLGTPSLWNIFGLQKNVHFLGGIMVGRWRVLDLSWLWSSMQGGKYSRGDGDDDNDSDDDNDDDDDNDRDNDNDDD